MACTCCTLVLTFFFLIYLHHVYCTTFDHRYEMDAKFFDEGVKNMKRHDVLEKRAFEVGYLALSLSNLTRD